jgi:hypothetical protein
MRSTCESGGGRAGLDHRVAHMGHSGGSHPPHEALCLSLYLAFSQPWISRHAECHQHPHALLASRALEHCPAARASLLSCPGWTARQSKGHARLPGAWSTTRKNSTCMQHKKHRCLFRSCTTCCIFAACTLSNAVAGGRPSAMFMQLPIPPQAHLPRPPLISIEYTLYPNGYRPQGPALARCGRETPWLRATRGASGRGGALARGLLGIRVTLQRHFESMLF